MVNDLLCSIISEKVVLLTLLDLCAAFDTIHHGLLLQRLRVENGVFGMTAIYGSIYTFLMDRYQHVKVNMGQSDNSLLQCDVPCYSVMSLKVPFWDQCCPLSVYHSWVGS